MAAILSKSKKIAPIEEVYGESLNIPFTNELLTVLGGMINPLSLIGIQDEEWKKSIFYVILGWCCFYMWFERGAGILNALIVIKGGRSVKNARMTVSLNPI